VLLLPASKPTVSVPLKTSRRQPEGKWHDQIVPDRITKGTRYPPLHVQIVVRKKKKFNRSWPTRKEPTKMMRSWTKIMWQRKRKKVKKLIWNWRTNSRNCPSLR
jgi:hypothetical protein